MRRVLMACAAAWMLAAPAFADYQLGLAAYRRGDYALALREWAPMAAAGHIDAQYRLGRLYFYGRGVARDDATAADWYRRAALQGHARSQTNLGYLYESGRGVDQDAAEAARWYRMAANQGRSEAQFRLGALLEAGRGVARDASGAAELYERAAKAGHGPAALALARCFDRGIGVKPDAKRAARWHRRAAERGVDADSVTLPELREPQDDESRSEPFTTDATEREEPVRVAPASSADAAPPVAPAAPAAGGDLAAALAAYERRDWPAARAALGPPAEAGDPEAQYRLANLLRAGLGVETDLASAAQWYGRAAEAGHGLSMYQLAFLHYRGRGVAAGIDRITAWVWFRRAADLDVGDAAQWASRVEREMTERERQEARDRLAAVGN